MTVAPMNDATFVGKNKLGTQRAKLEEYGSE
jgi:hypothetical protein